MRRMRRPKIIGVSLALLSLAAGCRASAPGQSAALANEQYLAIAQLRLALADSAGIIVIGGRITHSLDTLASLPQGEVVRVMWGTVAHCADGGSRSCPAAVVARCTEPSPFTYESRPRICPWGPAKQS